MIMVSYEITTLNAVSFYLWRRKNESAQNQINYKLNNCSLHSATENRLRQQGAIVFRGFRREGEKFNIMRMNYSSDKDGEQV